MVAVALSLPPAPVQVSVNEASACRGPTAALPDTGRLPDQPPLATQLSALFVDQLSVELPLNSMESGDALSVTSGAGGFTVTDTVSLPVPPGPSQLSVKLVVLCKGPTLIEPLVPRAPLQPPLAVHDVALVVDQLSVEAPLKSTVCGVADK